MKCAYYGGSFNPLHNGHVGLAQWLLKNQPLGVQHVLVAPVVEHAFGKVLRPFEQRKAWLQECLPSSNASIIRATEPLTADTIARLYTENPNYERIVVVLGSDILSELHKWDKWDVLTSLADILIVGRVGSPIPKDCPYPLVQPEGIIGVSSTELRGMVKAGRLEDVARLVPQCVCETLQQEEGV